MQIKLIWIDLVHSVNATRCGSTWLLVWRQFDLDQPDPNQTDPDQVWKRPKSTDIFLISQWKPMLWCSLEAPHWGTSNENLQHMF